MSDLFRNKYRIPSSRLQTWDYASEAMYFVTICTWKKESFFGKIIETPAQVVQLPLVETRCIASLRPDVPTNEMQLTEIGKIAHSEWLRTIELRPDMNLELGEFIIMPNHMHGIIIIGENKYNRFNPDRGLGKDAVHREYKKLPDNKFAPQAKNLSSIIRGYKSAVTTYARIHSLEHAWQSRFHDHIIRSHAEYEKISNYIINNPSNWKTDKFYKP
jgi:REP element-mobilizing transposase RayT